MKIDKNVTIPERRNKVVWPWEQMEPGDSFFAAGYVTYQNSKGLKRLVVSNAKLVVPGSEWLSLAVTEDGVRGVRVWRVK